VYHNFLTLSIMSVRLVPSTTIRTPFYTHSPHTDGAAGVKRGSSCCKLTRKSDLYARLGPASFRANVQLHRPLSIYVFTAVLVCVIAYFFLLRLLILSLSLSSYHPLLCLRHIYLKRCSL
jgi:hypothetical protein